MNTLVALKELEGFKVVDVKQYVNHERVRLGFDNKYLKYVLLRFKPRSVVYIKEVSGPLDQATTFFDLSNY
jgi:hypothetical protein